MRLPRAAPVPLAVRCIVLTAGVVLALVPERLTTAGVVAVLAGVVVGLLAPRAIGSTLVTAVFVLVWVVATGWGDVPSVPRTIAAAAALYVLHTGFALTACLPLDTAVAPGVITRWLRRSVPPLALAAVVVALDETLPREQGAAAFELLGLAGVVALAVGIAVAVLRRDSSSIE
jgi:hypothetical protein